MPQGLQRQPAARTLVIESIRSYILVAHLSIMIVLKLKYRNILLIAMNLHTQDVNQSSEDLSRALIQQCCIRRAVAESSPAGDPIA